MKKRETKTMKAFLIPLEDLRLTHANVSLLSIQNRLYLNTFTLLNYHTSYNTSKKGYFIQKTKGNYKKNSKFTQSKQRLSLPPREKTW